MKLDHDAEKLFVQKLSPKLKQLLPHSSETARQQFIEAVLKAEVVSSSPFEQLLEESCTPQEIYLALVYCRYAMSMLYNSLPETDKNVLTKQLFIRHDKNTSSLLTTMEGRYEKSWKNLQSELKQEGHDHLLSRARNEWAQEKEVNIYNLYQEMSISTIVEILRVGERSFTVNRTKELVAVIAASQEGDRAFTKLPKTKLSVELIVEEATGKTVHFQFGEFNPLHSEKRRETRVQNSKPDPIKLKGSNTEELKGKLLDFSASGFGIAFNTETTLQPGDQVTFNTFIHDHKFSGKGTIIWIQDQSNFCRVGMSLEYTQELHLRLENEVRRREKAIRSELKLRGIPNSLLS